MEINKIAERVAKRVIGGTEEISERGYGWTEYEAMEDAKKTIAEEYGRDYDYRRTVKVKKVKAPKLPNKVKVEKSTVRKGPVKKMFVMEQRWGWADGTNSRLTSDARFKKKYENQGEVLKAAKALALEYGEAISITLEAFCEGNTRLAIVTPESGNKGEWIFTFDYHN